MAQYIEKSALVAKIRILQDSTVDEEGNFYTAKARAEYNILCYLENLIDTLEVKEVDEQKERMNECPFRQVGCAMYEGHILECRGACSWVVDYPKLKELKAQKGE